MQPETIARTAEIGGTALTLTCSACRWLVDNHDFLASVGLTVGIGLGVLGYLTTTYFQWRNRQDNLRQKSRRKNRNDSNRD